jgi:hypothetical protein
MLNRKGENKTCGYLYKIHFIMKSPEFNNRENWLDIKVLGNGYTEEWLNFIIHCRDYNKPHRFDIVSDKLADGAVRLYDVIDDYLLKKINLSEALEKLRYKKYNNKLVNGETRNNQVSFHTEKAIRRLTIVEKTKIMKGD